MYQIRYNGEIVYDPRLERLAIRNTNAHLAVDECGSLGFTMDPGHDWTGKLPKMRGILELLEDGRPIFRGRIRLSESDFIGSETVEAEGLLACLNDSILPPHNFPEDWQNDANYQEAAESGNVVAYYLGWILGTHNAQVTESQQIKLGTVTVADSNNFIARSSGGYEVTWDAICDKLKGSALGGHFVPRYEADGTYLDYFADLPLTNTQPVKYAKNLLDLLVSQDAAETYSAILPLGANGLTIADLPDGPITDDLTKDGVYIVSKSGVAAFGRINRIMQWDDVTMPENLRNKATAELGGTGIKLLDTITVYAIDLHYEDGSTPSLMYGRYTRLESEPHGLSVPMPLMSMDIDLLDRAATTYTFGKSMATSADIQDAWRKETSGKINNQQIQIDNQEKSTERISQQLQEQITAVMQTTRSIILSALENYTKTTEFEEYKQTLVTELELLASGLNLDITRIQQQIVDVDGDMQQKFAEITTYIRFSADGMTIGRSDSDFDALLSNEKLSFRQSGVEVAYIQHNRLYITEAWVKNGLVIGQPGDASTIRQYVDGAGVYCVQIQEVG